MSIAAGASILALPDRIPELDDTAFVADGARIVGAVSLGPGASVWYNAVLRGDSAPIIIGPGSNVQDNVSIHVDAGHPVVVGSQVSIGHNAVVHGCTIGDGSLIGMGAVVLSGAVIGEGCLIAGGAVVLGGTEVPPGSLVAGVPAKVRRALSDDERASLVANAAIYLEHAATHVRATEA
ncbi:MULTISPECIES: gamma carbonic anhydrase family protein [Microbacterium]|jgi:carbonic anhydrase/acetyltransferase-like protein (isoleucine patch superfamily)|uniref:gamma carbonic anhydrase family protein n=1 Tax=Microbacterium TaxID=33882 RepID=UPI001656BA02|nr:MULTISPECIES: gamma carbonic anhydrase family protein [Microbacterium]MCT1363275.1 gamma carbonic anhydrase family protein [Microbacterium sp. p3-SID131]MCT1377750.1 gamma carbonic anhydrase family protein [Microbacterium sp. p3-SID337]MDH5132838.1 gamma carbonic anhydrase family protein [Microbacterium sp. RD10]MDH5136445.1 gamma carbonic anhydrase family protein [Microbacterium sp. RD11]MDH5145089.1 gamma carbonic anhydrase family protein [Microbacterium sp. RD12]